MTVSCDPAPERGWDVTGAAGGEAAAGEALGAEAFEAAPPARTVSPAPPGSTSPAPPTTRRLPGARPTIEWCRVEVDGHQVSYGVAGSGPSALFLHGWGLRANGYRRPILAMAAAGCRVVAPSLPGFGGTHE